MRVECFEFKRCCCCIPLRYGLLAWGYLKLVISILMVPLTLFNNLDHIDRSVFYIHMTFLGLFTLIMIGDIALTIVFVVGCHKKNPKLLRVYNYYSIGMLVLYVLAYLLFNGAHLFFLVQRTGLVFGILMLKSSLAIGFLNMVIQVYLILLNKSEIAKLENNCNFRFSNNANEAECKIVEEEGITANGVENEPVYEVYDENDSIANNLNENYKVV